VSTTDDLIRRMAGRAPDQPDDGYADGGHSPDDMIRQAAGRATGPPDDGYADAATEDQRAAAELAGLPPRHAHRLSGETPKALTADAFAMLEALGHEPPPTPGFDGGSREPLPPRAPMDMALRAGARSIRDRRGELTADDVFTSRRNRA